MRLVMLWLSLLMAAPALADDGEEPAQPDASSPSTLPPPTVEDRVVRRRVGRSVAVGGAVGLIGGAALGTGLGLVDCSRPQMRNTPIACMSWLALGMGGGVVGGTLGGPIAATSTAHRLGRRGWPGAVVSGSVNLLGTVTMVAGVATFSAPMVLTGGVVVFLASPMLSGAVSANAGDLPAHRIRAVPYADVGAGRAVFGLRGTF